MPWGGANSPYIANIGSSGAQKSTPAVNTDNPFYRLLQNPAPANPPASIAAPETQQNYNYTPYSAPQAPVVPTQTPEELADADSIFQAQKASLAATLAAYQADIESQKTKYDADYRDAIRKLGFTGNVEDIEKGTAKPGEGDWNRSDRTTASGRGFSSALNDFAARGMLRSSAYARAVNNLVRTLGDQLSSSTSSKSNAFADWNKQATNKATETKNAEALARQEAIARIKTQLGLA